MCASAGVIGWPLPDAAAKEMLSTMKRRGPDADGIYTNGCCTLLHARLAVVDIAGGAQPMTFEYADQN